MTMIYVKRDNFNLGRIHKCPGSGHRSELSDLSADRGIRGVKRAASLSGVCSACDMVR
jgi:hypothetical protein